VLVTTGLLGSSLAVAAVPVTGGASAASSSGAACQAPTAITTAEQAATTGVTPSTVTVGNVATISGPVPGLFEGASVGAKAYFGYVNSKGGVHGRKLEVDGYDDAFNGQQNQTETQEALSKDFGLVGDFSLFDSYGCKLLADNPAAADVSVTLDPGTNALPNVFSAQPLATGANLGGINFLKSRYPHDLKVGSLVSNVSTSLAQWAGQAAALKKAGYQITYVRDIGPLETDFTTDIIHMKALGVNVLDMTALDWQVGAIIMQDMTQQGWRPALIFSGGPIYADQFIKTAGGAAAANGIWLTQSQALYLGEDSKAIPAVNEFNTWVKKVDPSWTPDLFTLYGWASAQLFTQALAAAGPNPTRGAVLAQLEKITAFGAGGLLATSNPAQKKPASCFLAARIVNGKYQRVGDPPNGGFICKGGSFYYANVGG